MENPPKTLAEARKHRYYEYADGYAFNPICCAYAIKHGRFRGSQCNRAPGHGPAGLYCPGHAKIVPSE